MDSGKVLPALSALTFAMASLSAPNASARRAMNADQLEQRTSIAESVSRAWEQSDQPPTLADTHTHNNEDLNSLNTGYHHAHDHVDSVSPQVAKSSLNGINYQFDV